MCLWHTCAPSAHLPALGWFKSPAKPLAGKSRPDQLFQSLSRQLSLCISKKSTKIFPLPLKGWPLLNYLKKPGDC